MPSIWMVGYSVAGVVGAIAVIATGVRRRKLGILLVLAPYLGFLVFPTVNQGGEVAALVASLIQVVLIWAARRVTCGRGSG